MYDDEIDQWTIHSNHTHTVTQAVLQKQYVNRLSIQNICMLVDYKTEFSKKKGTTKQVMCNVSSSMVS